MTKDTLKKFVLAFLDHFESWFCMFLLAFFIMLIFLQILFRHLSLSFPWTEELARFAFLWFVLFGACYATRRRAFNRVTAQFALLPSKAVSFCLLVSDVIWFLFSLVLAWQGVLAVLRLSEYPYFTPALDWQLGWIYLAFPLSFFLMAIRIVQVNWLRFFCKEQDPAFAESKAAFPENKFSSSPGEDK